MRVHLVAGIVFALALTGVSDEARACGNAVNAVDSKIDKLRMAERRLETAPATAATLLLSFNGHLMTVPVGADPRVDPANGCWR